MKIQGLFVLSVRTYLGRYNGNGTWKHHKYIVGSIEGGKIKDYKTGELHDYIARNPETNVLTVDKIEVGHVYAVEASGLLNKNQTYSKRELDKFIKNSAYFSDEYKYYNDKKVKVIMKK